MLDVRVTDFTQGTCAISGKETDCFSVRLSGDSGAVLISTAEFTKQIRFMAQVEANRGQKQSKPAS